MLIQFSLKYPSLHLVCILLFKLSSLYGQVEEEKAQTPFGLVPKSKIHYVDNNHHLQVIKGEVQLVNTISGNIDEVYSSSKSTASSEEKYKNGWNTYAYYGINLIDKAPTYFSAKWTVPPPPTTCNHQIIYLFNAQIGIEFLENGNHVDHILQPVLQWGFTPSGGGYYWAICNWYVNDQEYFYDSLIVVNQGTVLEGVLVQTSSSNDLFNYDSYFKGYPTGLHIDNLPELKLTYIALETYGADIYQEYPKDEKIKFYDIHIETDIINPKLRWNIYKDESDPNELGQFTRIVNPSSNGGQIEIHFHKPYSIDGYEKIHIYPNPVNNYLHVSPNSILFNCRIEIVNLEGDLLFTDYYKYFDFEYNIDCQKFLPGIYLIRFSHDINGFIYENESHVFKFIKR